MKRAHVMLDDLTVQRARRYGETVSEGIRRALGLLDLLEREVAIADLSREEQEQLIAAVEQADEEHICEVLRPLLDRGELARALVTQEAARRAARLRRQGIKISLREALRR